MKKPEVTIVNDIQELAHHAAGLFVELGTLAISTDGHFRVALSGGSTPKALYHQLCQSPYRDQIDWSAVNFFFGDERAVSPASSESNFYTAQHHLFEPLQISNKQIFRMEADLPDPDEAARRYQQVLLKQFKSDDTTIPRFHLIVLGLGEDGHTASLFSHSPSYDTTTPWVVPSISPKGIKQRVTFTPSLINQAHVVVFLVSGAEKALPVRKILSMPQTDEPDLPAMRISPRDGRLLWLIDQAAASDLSIDNRTLL